ncbi:MAG TPA: TonB-dependent receptor [Povalibacter sp.]|nr:TonB-dependent receptor [Povalibacter sp.]
MNKHASRLLRAAIALPSMTVAGLALAQDTAPGSKVLEEIVVTSTKRAESLKDVPISVAAYTQETMDKQSVRSFEDIARMTPGVTFSNRGSGNSHRTDIAIRGISAGPGTATTGVYLDETPIQIRPDCCASTNPYPVIFDLERVEILRGPQGTLFGAGSEGGTIRFILPEPSLTEQQVYARAGIAFTEHGDSTQEGGAAVGGPLVDDSLGFRLSAYYREQGGYVDHINRLDQHVLSKDADSQDALVVRGALKWAVTDSLTVSPSLYFQRERTDDSSMYWEAFSDPDQGRFVNANPVITPTDDRFVMPVLKIEWGNDAVGLVSNTSYMKRDNVNTFDDTLVTTAIFAGTTGNYIPKELAHVAMPGDVYSGQRVWTQEVRLQSAQPDARLNWVAGVFYQKIDQGYHYYVDAHQLEDVLNYGNTGPWTTVEDALGMGLYQGKYILWENETMKNTEIAAYANVDFRLTDQFKATVGLRYSHNEYQDIDTQAGPVVSSEQGFTHTSKTTDKPFTPKFGLSYQPDDDNMYYVTASKGYRQGFTTGAVASRCQADLDALGVSGAARGISPDSVWNYEIGSKNRLAQGRLQIDASLFRIDWKDIQSSLGLPCGNTWRGNLGTARSQGFDLSLAARVAGQLTVGLSVGFADAKYTETIRGSTGTVLRADGERLPVPRWNVASSLQYDFDAFGHEGYARLDQRYSGARPITELDPTLPWDGQTHNLDLRMGMKFGNTDVSVFGSNLSDEHPVFNRNRPMMEPPPADLYRAMTVRPRTFGVTVLYRY